ncbi:MAG: 4Fe-4S dicluster domain-containing protein, partial [Desulfovibrio sp.]
MKKNYDALVVGAGIGGIRSALDLAETGRKVLLIDKKAAIGGLLTQLDHQFPTDHCGMCKMLPLTERDSSSQFCLRKGLFHRNIDILLSTELEDLSGDPGEFQAILRKESGFVDPAKCIGCGECAEVCPVKVPSEFNAGLTKRAAVHLPVPHAIPNHYVVDLEHCVRCGQCQDACPTGAIDFKSEARKEFTVLIADPDPKAAQAAAKVVEELGFSLEIVSTGDEAISRVLNEEEKSRIGLLLLDMSLDEPDPERVITRCLEIDPNLAVVLMDEDVDNEEIERLMELGVREFAAKPLDETTTAPWLDKLFMRIVSDELIEVDVATVIMAGGFECFNPEPMSDVLGWGKYPGVLSSLEFERLISGTGNNQLAHPVHGGPVKKIAWLQCVGSRDLRRNADFCSSICCMISIKEANLAKKLTRNQEGGPAEATVFYMDMRVFGKNYQRYFDAAKDENGVKFVRARLHSVLPIDQDQEGAEGSVRVQYVNEQGEMTEDWFDMLVLAVGARPPKNMDKLARAAGVEVNDWGFVKTLPFEPSRTTRMGVFSAGSMSGAKDIT